MAVIAELVRRDEQRKAVRDHAAMTCHGIGKHFKSEPDYDDIRSRYETVMQRLED